MKFFRIFIACVVAACNFYQAHLQAQSNINKPKVLVVDPVISGWKGVWDRFEKAKRETAAIADARNKGDLQEIHRLIERSEVLWSNDPVYYLDFETQAAVLLEASNPPVVLSIFENIMKKHAPDNLDDSVNYFLQKTVFVLRYINTPLIANNQERLLKIANFLGEIRSNTIPGYPVVIHHGLNPVEMGWYDNGTHSISFWGNVPLARTNLYAQDESLNVTNQFQMILRQCNDVLLPHLLSDCSRFSPDNPTNADFLKQVIAAAHLTEDESSKLKGKNN